jgi:hypothetical protein
MVEGPSPVEKELSSVIGIGVVKMNVLIAQYLEFEPYDN